MPAPHPGVWSLALDALMCLCGGIVFSVFWHRAALLKIDEGVTVISIKARTIGLHLSAATFLILIAILLSLAMSLGMFIWYLF